MEKLLGTVKPTLHKKNNAISLKHDKELSSNFASNNKRILAN